MPLKMILVHLHDPDEYRIASVQDLNTLPSSGGGGGCSAGLAGIRDFVSVSRVLPSP
jgi:hypothetical protein